MITQSDNAEDFYLLILKILDLTLSKSHIKAQLTTGMKGQVDILGKKIYIFEYLTRALPQNKTSGIH